MKNLRFEAGPLDQEDNAKHKRCRNQKNRYLTNFDHNGTFSGYSVCLRMEIILKNGKMLAIGAFLFAVSATCAMDAVAKDVSVLDCPACSTEA